MFIVTLRFAKNKSQAAQWLEKHNGWLQQGFENGWFLLCGGLSGGSGGVILCKDIGMEQVQAFVQEDPFVQHAVVTPEILQVCPTRTAPALSFLINEVEA